MDPPTAPPPVCTRPDASRAFARGLVLVQLGVRASVDLQANHPEARDAYQEILGWLENRPFTEELEAPELARLSTPLGELSREEVLACSTEFEAAGVLGWALGFLPPPPLQGPVRAPEVVHAFGLRNPALLARLLQHLNLRPRAELDREQQRLELVAQRLVRRWMGSLASPEGCQERWSDQAREAGLPLLAGDLTLEGLPVTEAGDAQVARALQTLGPRRRALSWLQGDAVLYSQAPDLELPRRLTLS